MMKEQFDSDVKVPSAAMGQYVVADSGSSTRYLGADGIGPCVALVLKGEGVYVVGHIAAGSLLEASIVAMLSEFPEGADISAQGYHTQDNGELSGNIRKLLDNFDIPHDIEKKPNEVQFMQLAVDIESGQVFFSKDLMLKMESAMEGSYLPDTPLSCSYRGTESGEEEDLIRNPVLSL